ncbi:MAG: hypothetical protein F4Y01_02625 [Gammaproteobacteria bacterium]|nr:hypothetical protein [Gammaproteobacteria bacterium]
MLLRASGQRENRDFNLNAVNEEGSDSGVEHSDHLRALTEAAVGSRWDELAAIRDEAAAAMGEQAMVDALTVAAGFNGITRVADATGIPLDPTTQESTVSMRSETRIDEFDYAAKTARYEGRAAAGG